MSNIPSIAMIPSAYKSGKVYSVLPSDGSADFNFARASEATRVNQNGLIEKVGSNVPRLNYPMIDGVVSGCPSLLLEPQRSNLVTYSEDFSNSGWSKIGSTEIISNNSISPDGSLNSDKVNATTTNNGLLAFEDGFSVSSGSDYSVSFFAKKGNLRYLQLFHGSNQVVGNSRTNFDLENGVVTVSDSGHDASVEDYGNGWFRCIVVLETLSTTLQLYFSAVKDANATRSAVSDFNENDNLFIWGAQLEAGSYATSYIPTNGSTVTREAETCNNAGDASTFNDSEGVLFAEISALADDLTFRHITISDGSNSNIVQLRYRSTSNVLQALLYVGGVGEAYGVTLNDIATFSKALIKYKENDVSFWVNGFEIVADTSASTFPNGTLNTLRFERGDGANDFYGNTKQIQYFNTALTDAELEKLTSWQSFNEMATAQQYSII